MKFYLSTKQQDKVKENEGLVRYILKKLSIASNDYDDAFQDGVFGLMKGVASYDSNKTANFSTYITRCITNEVFMGLRKNRKYQNILSLETVVQIDKTGDSFTIGDTIFDESIKDFDVKIINSELICEYINVLLNCLSSTEKIILLYKMVGIPQHYIAMILDVCQSYVSRLLVKAQDKVKKIIDRKQIYEKKIIVKLVDEIFEIKFFIKDLNINDELESFLGNIRNKLKLSGFKIIYKDDYVLIYFHATQKSFIYIAEIINSLENQKSVCKKDIYTIIREYEQDKKERIIKLNANKNIDIRGNKIRDHISKRTSFNFKELKEKFPDLSDDYIRGFIYKEKRKGTIYDISRGEYSVISKKNQIIDDRNKRNPQPSEIRSCI